MSDDIEYDFKAMDTEVLIDMVDNYKSYESVTIAGASHELKLRQEEHLKVATLENLKGTFKGSHSLLLLFSVLILIVIASFVGWSYTTEKLKDWTSVAFLVGAALVIVAAKYFDRRRYIEFDEEFMHVFPLFRKKRSVLLSEILFPPVVSGKIMTVVTGDTKEKIDLSLLTKTDRSIFINTLDACIAKNNS